MADAPTKEDQKKYLEDFWLDSNKDKRNRVYVHYKGGIYIIDKFAFDTATEREVVVYTHLWPHAPSSYVRDREEFFEEFQPDGWPIRIRRFEPAFPNER